MTRYTTVALVRKVIDVLVGEAGDTVIEDYIDIAQEMFLREITGEMIHEEMVDENGYAPSINGTNRLFYTAHKLIADTDFDTDVDGNDITVYLWPDRDDESTIVTVSATDISSVTSHTGLVLFKSGKAPATTYEKITCTYRYYLSYPNWTLVSFAVALLTGWIWVCKDKLLLPDRVQVGAYRWSNIKPAYERLWDNYIRTLNVIKTKKVARESIKQQLPWNDPDIINLYYAEMGGRS